MSATAQSHGTASPLRVVHHEHGAHEFSTSSPGDANEWSNLLDQEGECIAVGRKEATGSLDRWSFQDHSGPQAAYLARGWQLPKTQKGSGERSPDVHSSSEFVPRVEHCRIGG